MAPKLNLAGFKAEYRIDVPELDEQHKTFFDMLRSLEDAVSDMYRPLAEDEIDPVLDVMDELRDYALTHFRTEESMMKDAGYPGLDKQKREHNRFISDLLRMQAEVLNGALVPAMKIRNFMHDWYRNHILKLDKPFGEYLSSRSS